MVSSTADFKAGAPRQRSKWSSCRKTSVVVTLATLAWLAFVFLGYSLFLTLS